MKILGIGRAVCQICGYSWAGVMPEHCDCSQCGAEMSIILD